MKFTDVAKAATVLTDGMTNMLLRGLFNAKILDYDQIGSWAERFGNRARVDGLSFHLDNRLLLAYFKGTIVANAYEEDERKVISKHLISDVPVIELGASIGVVACMVNRSLKSPDRHVVVEANPELIPTLKKNRDTNGCQFAIVEAAIGYGSDSVTFFTNGVSLLGSIYNGGGKKLEVRTRTLQSIAENAGFRYFTLICDIEGSEIGMIEHEIDFIREHVDLLLIETHDETPYGDDGVKLVLEQLAANGFAMVDSIRSNYCFRNGISPKSLS